MLDRTNLNENIRQYTTYEYTIQWLNLNWNGGITGKKK